MEYAAPKYEGEPTAKALANGLATLGRYGDSYMVHAAEGETIVPKEILEANPELKQHLLWQMKMMGIENPNRYVVGSEFNSINPVTGQPEFFFKKIFKTVKDIFKKVLPVAAPIIGNMIAPGIGGPIASALATKLSGGSWGDAFKGAALSYGAQTLGSGIMGAVNAPVGGGTSGFFEGLKTGAMAPITAAGNLFSSGAANPLQQGIFGNVNAGTRGFNMKTLLPMYDAGVGTVAPDHLRGAGAISPPAGGSEAGSLTLASSCAGQVAAASGGILSNWKGPALAAGAAGLLGFAMTPDQEEELNNLPLGDPRKESWERYKNMTPEQKASPEGRELYQQAVGGPMYTKKQGARIAGVTPFQAEEFYKRWPERIPVQAGGMIQGPGTGTSDSIPALLSDGEFVMTDAAVRGAGRGDRELGAARMYDLMSQFERTV